MRGIEQNFSSMDLSQDTDLRKSAFSSLDDLRSITTFMELRLSILLSSSLLKLFEDHKFTVITMMYFSRELEDIIGETREKLNSQKFLNHSVMSIYFLGDYDNNIT